MRTITARLDGKSANFASDIADVRTTIDLRYPSLWAIIAVMCAGPFAAAFVAFAWKRFIAHIMRKAQAVTQSRV
jgi:coenzyme F420-reducing hydrogenase delta subunit